MTPDKTPPPPADHRGTQVALIFALVAERLSTYYEHGVWLTPAQGATRAGEWLGRTKRALPLPVRRHLSELSDQLARQIASTLSREAGLYAAHELTESLDPNYRSELALSVMAQCEAVLDACGPSDDAST